MAVTSGTDSWSDVPHLDPASWDVAVKSGPAPWSAGFSKNPVSGRVKFASKRSLRNVRDLRRVTGRSSGNVYNLPAKDYKDVVEYLNLMHMNTEGSGMRQINGGLSAGYKKAAEKGKHRLRDVHTPGDFIDFGFSNEQKENITTVACKGGHIAMLSYNPVYMLLKVQFSKSCNLPDTVVFFNLPANVATTLMYLAESNAMAAPGKNGEERHAVGVEFWNLVRVRGTVHETQYSFSYTEGGGNMTSSRFTQADANKIAQKTQVRTPNSSVVKRPGKSETSSSRLVSSYDEKDLPRIFGDDGDYRDWFEELKGQWSASGSSFFVAKAKNAESYYRDGMYNMCKKELNILAQSGVVFPDLKNDTSYGEGAISDKE